MNSLDSALTHAILDYLGVSRMPPTAASLDALVAAYTRRVPWESASRIVQHSQTPALAERPRWPEQFWQTAIEKGTGGTCFESNYAFFSLLQTLGYSGYLTINDMRDMNACHTAIVINLNHQKTLVDVGLPLHAPLLLNPDKTTKRETAFHTYTITPDAANHYVIERDRHPRTDCFMLVDTPVPEDAYCAATTQDYDTNGLFLDRVIIVRVVEGQVWRFQDEGAPYVLETFVEGYKRYAFLGDEMDAAADKLARKFDMDRETIYTALQLTQPEPE
ncbi:MAG: hypothetical protein OHK0046_21380 [Anaerolineae bacterium]